MLKKLSLALVLLVLAGAAAWWWIGGLPGVVAAALPDFPAYPPARTSLADSGGIAAGGEGRIYYATSTPFDLDVILAGMRDARPTTGVGTLFLPATATPEHPVPAMVLLHGSGGITPGREMEYGRLLQSHGIAAFVVDYYAPRGVTSETPYMLRVLSVTEFDAVADAYAVLRLLASHPAIDGRRIGLMGFSYGGMATRIAMDERIRRVLAPHRWGFAAFADFYGPCFQDLGTQATNGAPLLTLRGSADASNDLTACREREAQLAALGVAVESHVYPGAGHAWEAREKRRLFEDAPYVAGCTVHYDARGHSSVDGHPIVDLRAGASRAQRVVVRMRSGRVMQDCVKHGYVIGRDDATRERASAALLDFLRRSFGLPRAPTQGAGGGE